MELTVERQKFLSELQILQGIVERKNTIPILANVLLRADEKGVSLTSTDLDLTLHTRMDGRVNSGGGVCVPARRLFEIVRLLDSESVKLKIQENNYLGVTAGTGDYKLVAQPAEDFPTVPNVEGKPALAVSLADWKKATRKIFYAISGEEKRFQLSGAHLSVKAGRIELVATDGHRLALAEFAGPSGKTALPAILIPKKALSEILKMDAPENAQLEIFHSENYLAFSIGERKLVARLLDVNFPDYEKVLSRESENRVTVNRLAIENGVRRISLFSSERARGIKLFFEEKSLTLSSASQEAGSGVESLAVDYAGPAVTLGLNAEYLLDFLAEAETENVFLEVKDENTQCLCRPGGEVAGITRYLYVVMPMRL